MECSEEALKAEDVYPLSEYAYQSEARVHKIEEEAKELKQQLEYHKEVSLLTLNNIVSGNLITNVFHTYIYLYVLFLVPCSK